MCTELGLARHDLGLLEASIGARQVGVLQSKVWYSVSQEARDVNEVRDPGWQQLNLFGAIFVRLVMAWVSPVEGRSRRHRTVQAMSQHEYLIEME